MIQEYVQGDKAREAREANEVVDFLCRHEERMARIDREVAAIKHFLYWHAACETSAQSASKPTLANDIWVSFVLGAWFGGGVALVVFAAVELARSVL